eukprot:COSAG04_NODE_27368_length_284_cov_0.432432_1_plen_42_part_10
MRATGLARFALRAKAPAASLISLSLCLSLSLAGIVIAPIGAV